MVVASADNIIASSGGEAIAAITNDLATGPLTNAGLMIGISTTAINAAIALPTDPLPVTDLNEYAGTSIDDNSIWVGGSYTGIDDPENWVVTNTNVDHTNPNIGGTTFATQEAATCFAAGTLIATDAGEVTVETLQIGNLVRAENSTLVPVLWVGRQTVSKLRHGLHMQPVRIRAGALGGSLPHCDLTVTADHGMILDGLVINASALVNGDDINWVPMADLNNSFIVYHIETEAHDVILAKVVLYQMQPFADLIVMVTLNFPARFGRN